MKTSRKISRSDNRSDSRTVSPVPRSETGRDTRTAICPAAAPTAATAATWQSDRPPWVREDWTRRRVAVVVDLENLAHDRDRHYDPAATEALCARLDPALASWPTTVALKRNLAARYLPSLAGRPWRLLLVDNSPDAADIALIEAAHAHIASGVNDLVILSGDHGFAALAAHARLHVISSPSSLSRSLRLAATSTTLLTPHPWHRRAPA